MYLYHNDVPGTLRLHFGVLHLDGHRPPIMQQGLVHLGQGGGTLGGVLEAGEQLADLARGREASGR